MKAKHFHIGPVASGSAFRAVFCNSRQVSPAMRDETKLTALMAEKQRIAARSQPGFRECIKCRVRFESQGAHERLCPACRKRASPEGQDQGWPAYRATAGM